MFSKRRLVQSLKYVRSYPTQINEKVSRKVKPLKGIIKYTESFGLDSKMRSAIPEHYFTRRPSHLITRLYVIDPDVAESVTDHVFPDLFTNKNQLVCDTNAGLGLISQKLLAKGVKSVRLYEWCKDFRRSLHELHKTFPNKTELFNYNLYNLDGEWRETSSRIERLLKDVPHKAWDDEPCMTIVGPMSNLHFIKYLLNAVNNSHEIVSCGRFQIFALMTPHDYLKCSATTGSATDYSKFNVNFQNLFDYKLLEKYPRKSFLPWNAKMCQDNVDIVDDEIEYIYLVKMSFKKILPMPLANVSQFITFVNYCMKAKFPVIPFLEASFPGIGVNLMMPENDNKEIHFQNMSIFTEFRDLLPKHWQQIFLEMLQRPEFNDFISLLTIQDKSKDKDKIKEKQSR